MNTTSQIDVPINLEHLNTSTAAQNILTDLHIAANENNNENALKYIYPLKNGLRYHMHEIIPSFLDNNYNFIKRIPSTTQYNYFNFIWRNLLLNMEAGELEAGCWKILNPFVKNINFNDILHKTIN
jgi:hypothetical protein